jgi:SRSO17 transposase
LWEVHLLRGLRGEKRKEKAERREQKAVNGLVLLCQLGAQGLRRLVHRVEWSSSMTKPSMASTVSEGDTDWREEFLGWLSPFLDALARAEQRHWAPKYLEGLLGPGDRKSVEPMAERVCPGDVQQLHHFVSTSPWATAPLEGVLARTADSLVGGKEAVLIIDDTALIKQGRHSVGVARQYCGVLGKRTNCQVLVSLTLAQSEVPVPLALRLYLPEAWASDAERRREAKVPLEVGFQTKGEIALAQLDRVMAAGVRFGTVIADAGYGSSAEFRAGLTERDLTWAAGIQAKQKVYPAGVTLVAPARPARGTRGRPPTRPLPSRESVSAEEMINGLGPRAFRRTSWRVGTKGPLEVEVAVVRVRVADGDLMMKRRGKARQHLPGEEAWLVCERRSSGERKYYLTNHPARTSRLELLRSIKARWSCEQAHQQLKEELGLDHFECRSWLGLHHHALLSMIAFAFLQHRRLEAVEARGKVRGQKRHRAGGKIGAPRTPARTRAMHAVAINDARDARDARSSAPTLASGGAACAARSPTHHRAPAMSSLSRAGQPAAA